MIHEPHPEGGSHVPDILLTGVLPVIQTPFAADESIDHGVLRAEAEWCLDAGVDGLTIGMVSEVTRLSDAERIAVTGTLAEVAAARGVPLVASAGAESTAGAKERAIAAVGAGATALMVTPPMMLASDEDALLHYFAEVFDAVDVPIVVQDASGYIGTPMSVEFQVALIDRFHERVWLKPEAPPFGQRVSRLRDLSGGRARILEGTGGIALIDSFRRGVVGTMPAADVCWAVVALWRALSRGDQETAERIHGPLASLIALQTSLDAFVAIEKHLLHRQGILPDPRSRQPVGFVLDTETAVEADRLADILTAVCASERAI